MNESHLTGLLIEAAPYALLMVNQSGQIALVNAQTERLFGYSRSELLGAKVELLVPERFRHQHEADRTGFLAHPQIRKMGAGRDLYGRRKDGSEVPVEIGLSPLTTSTGEFVLVSIIDITERKQLEQERERLLQQEQQARAIAEAATRAKDQFLSIVSHELRTPLNAILGYTRLTIANPHDAALVVQNCEIVQRSAHMQRQLIDDLLDSARITSGKLRLEIAPLDLQAVLEETLSVIRPAAEAKRINLIALVTDAPRAMLGDAARLRQVVWNLLQNAIKFTPEGGRIELFVQQEQQHIHLTVRDTGQGITPDFLPYVFDHFSQYDDTTRNKRNDGLGLGLALARQLVELHGGTIAVASAGAGQGTEFTVTLPLRDPVSAAPVQAIAEDQSATDALPLAEIPRLDGIRVLVVDDEEDARLMVAALLSELGAVITPVASGTEARTRMAAESFDVLLCDITMPEESGYDVVRRLRLQEREQGTPQLPAVALTALARSSDRLQALNAGFQMHVAKPVELAELALVITSLLRNR
ncbi:MAG TPA: ATP-binding protein [Blastocatellia bacterium]|nr:ATP-binding protein [Blastocatellia bacterium]